MTELTQARLQELFHYDPDSGLFTRRVATGRHGCHRVGEIAGSLKENGRRRIVVDGKRYYAYRLAWLYVYGVWPTHGIDHRRGVSAGDGINNLREATQAQNCQNKIARGYTRRRNKWLAQIRADGVYHYLGTFHTEAEARAAYLRAKAELHTFEPNPVQPGADQ